MPMERTACQSHARFAQKTQSIAAEPNFSYKLRFVVYHFTLLLEIAWNRRRQDASNQFFQSGGLSFSSNCNLVEP